MIIYGSVIVNILQISQFAILCGSSMRVITKKAIVDAMNTHSQWRMGLKLWLSIYDRQTLRFDSYQQIADVWRSASGWSVDRLPARTLKAESQKGPLDIYIFDIHKNECRVITWLNPKNGTFYVKDVCSHADYDKWWRKQSNKK